MSSSVALVLDWHSAGTIVVDGMDLSGVVRAVRVQAEVGSRPSIMLDVVAGVSATTEDADVRVLLTIGKDSAVGDTVADACRALADILDGNARTPVPM